MNILNELVQMQDQQIEFAKQARDNVFSADHRNLMLKEYGYTSAEGIQIYFNKETNQAEIV